MVKFLQIALLILFGGLCFLLTISCRTPAGNSLEGKLADISIKADKSVYKPTDTIRVMVSGNVWCTGECKAKPHFGLLSYRENQWDTIVNLSDSHLQQVDCGPPVWNFTKDVIEVSRKNLSFTPISLVPGIYKLSVISADRKRYIYSEEFELE